MTDQPGKPVREWTLLKKEEEKTPSVFAESWVWDSMTVGAFIEVVEKSAYQAVVAERDALKIELNCSYDMLGFKTKEWAHSFEERDALAEIRAKDAYINKIDKTNILLREENAALKAELDQARAEVERLRDESEWLRAEAVRRGGAWEEVKRREWLTRQHLYDMQDANKVLVEALEDISESVWRPGSMTEAENMLAGIEKAGEALAKNAKAMEGVEK